MMTLSTDIQEAIRKSLPEQTAAELKTYLHEAEANKQKVKDLVALGVALRQQLDEKTKDCNELWSYRNKGIELNRREAELASKELQLQHKQEINQIQALCEREKTGFAIDIVRTVFKSQPVGYAFARSVGETSNEAIPNGSGYPNMVNTSSTITENVTKREITE